MLIYSKITEDDLSEIISLYEQYLNSGEYIRNSLKEDFYYKQYIGYKVKEEDRIVGFFFGNANVEFTYPHPELERTILDIAVNKKIFTLGGLLILPEYRKRGIARQLVNLLSDDIVKQKYNTIMIELWVYPDGTIPARNPLNHMGSVFFSHTIKYFYADNYKYNIKCPVCGDNCKCGALIELLALHGKKGGSLNEKSKFKVQA